MSTFNEKTNVATVNEFELHDLVARLNSTKFLEEIGLVTENGGGSPQFEMTIENPDEQKIDIEAFKAFVIRLNKVMDELGDLDSQYHDIASYTCGYYRQ